MRNLCKTLLLAACCLLLGAGPALAAYPDRPITLIIGFGAGGATDIMGRALGNLIAKELNATIVVKNVAGGGGTIAAAELSAAKPDGYTLGYLPVGTMASQPNLRDLPYKWDAFTPIALVSDNPVAVVASGKATWKDFKEAVEEARANPGKLFFASSSPGSSPHISQQALFAALGVKVGHMPARDSASAIQALQAGTVQFYADPPVIIDQFGLKGLGIFADKRLEAFPDVPTFKEMGIDVPNFSGWHAFWGPPQLPAEVLATLEKAAQAAITSPEFRDVCARTNMAVSYMGSKEFAKFFAEQSALYRKYSEEFGLKKK